MAQARLVQGFSVDVDVPKCDAIFIGKVTGISKEGTEDTKGEKLDVLNVTTKAEFPIKDSIAQGQELSFRHFRLSPSTRDVINGFSSFDFQEGDAATMYRSVREQIFPLPDDCLLYPAHDYRGLTVTSVGEEKRFNPRLGGSIGLGDFVGHMVNLKLAHPKQMAIAVPANLHCGKSENDHLPIADPGWAPLTFTFAGLVETQPQVLEEYEGPLQILDVRETDEYAGSLGHIAGAILIPLGELSARVDELDRTRPIVAVCRAGSRSAQAINILKQAGFSNLANLAGGMLRWRAENHPVEGGSA